MYDIVSARVYDWKIVIYSPFNVMFHTGLDANNRVRTLGEIFDTFDFSLHFFKFIRTIIFYWISFSKCMFNRPIIIIIFPFSP